MAALPSMFTRSVPHHRALVARARAVVAKLRACSLAESDLAGLFALPAPWPDSIYVLSARDPLRGGEGCARPPGVERVFANPGYEVLRVAVPARR